MRARQALSAVQRRSPLNIHDIDLRLSIMDQRLPAEVWTNVFRYAVSYWPYDGERTCARDLMIVYRHWTVSIACCP
jgi:hypothetical protein